jgi:hypothetical protein
MRASIAARLREKFSREEKRGQRKEGRGKREAHCVWKRAIDHGCLSTCTRLWLAAWMAPWPSPFTIYCRQPMNLEEYMELLLMPSGLRVEYIDDFIIHKRKKKEINPCSSLLHALY